MIGLTNVILILSIILIFLSERDAELDRFTQ